MDSERPLGFAGRHALSPFRAVTDFDQFGMVAGPHKLRLGNALFSCPGSPLFRRNELPALVTAAHDSRISVPGAELYFIPDYELGADGLLQRNGSVFTHPAIMPNHYIQTDTMPAHWVRGLFRPDAEIIEVNEPIGVALNPHMVWGHFLLEMFVRLHLLAEMRARGRALRITVPSGAPAWLHAFVALYFGTAEIIGYDADRQRVKAPGFVLPSMMSRQRYHLHPMINTLVAQLLARVVGAGNPAPAEGRLIYLSRRRHQGWHGVANEADVETTMADLGFTVFHPQEHTILEQLAVYSNARCMVSQFSSAAHNALFAPIGMPVLCFGWMNRCQSAIAALRGQPIGYLAPSNYDLIYPSHGRPDGAFRFTIDCRQLAQELPAFLRFAEQRRTAP